MDYGHTVNSRDDLNLENWGASMPSAPFLRPTIVSSEVPATASEPREAVGIASAESAPGSAPGGIPGDNLEGAQESVQNTPDLAKSAIDPLAPPPMGQVIQISSAPAPLTAAPANPGAIRTEGDHLSSAAITEIDNAVSELGQTGDLATFYDKVQSLTEANLENSFNRKIGESH